MDALVTFNETPIEALLLNASHKHSGPVFNTVFNPEQQLPSGFDTSLPLDTNDKQSAMFSIRVEQSTVEEEEDEEEEGDGAVAWW